MPNDGVLTQLLLLAQSNLFLESVGSLTLGSGVAFRFADLDPLVFTAPMAILVESLDGRHSYQLFTDPLLERLAWSGCVGNFGAALPPAEGQKDEKGKGGARG